MKGADRNLRDNDGDRAVDLIYKHVSNVQMQEDLKILLANPRKHCTGVLALFCVR